MKLRFNSLTLFLLSAVTLWGCMDSAPEGPSADLGSATVSKYVSVGNSLTAGYQSGSLYASAQVNSFPNLIATQLKIAGASIGEFQQPIFSNPGTAGRMELTSLVGPVIVVNPNSGTPTNITLTRPYDNLGIPGAVLYDFLDTTDFASKSTQRKNPLFSAILRNSAFGKSIFSQMQALNPDLVTFWLGNNDVLGFATSGGTSVSPFSGQATPTPSATFAALYTQSMDALRAALPNAKLVVANIPDVKSIPFFTTVGPKMAASIPTLYYLRYQKHGNSSLAFDSTKLTEANAPLITLKASTYAALLGQPTGKWYRDIAASEGVPVSTVIGAGIDTTQPFGFHPQNPFPDALVLDAGEQATAAQAIADFNTTIAAQAAAKGAALVDINGFFNNVKLNGFIVGGETYTTSYISGGLFSLDGVHPSSKGAGIVANEFIKAINSKFGTHIPLVNVVGLPGIPAPLGKFSPGSIPAIPLRDWKQFDSMWNNF